MARMNASCHMSRPIVYSPHASVSSDGRVAEGVVVLRGLRTHSVALLVASKHEFLLPGSFVPGEYTYAGVNLTWVELSDTVVGETKLKQLLADALAGCQSRQGQMVLFTLKDARGFLRTGVYQ